MKTMIKIHYIKNLANGSKMDMGSGADTYSSIEEAKRALDDFASTHEEYDLSICRVCDEVDSADYCEIIEDDL